MILAVLTSALPVSGERDAWVCPGCGREGNTGNFCGTCAHPAPSPDPTAMLTPVSAGSTVIFGRYEQDNNTKNGPEEIEWIVLDYDEKEHKALLLSRYGLVGKPYNIKRMDITWESCTLRDWLNGEFLQSAFSAEEQAAILTTAVDNSASQRYSKWNTDGGNNTQDQIFLLSYSEANRYLDVTDDDDDNTKARIAPTANAKGAWTSNVYLTADGVAAGWWWLRSPGNYQTNAAIVRPSGSLGHSIADSLYGVVRPAFWLNLDSGIL